MKRRLFAIVIAVLMVLTLVPVTAMVQENAEYTAEAEPAVEAPPSDAPEGAELAEVTDDAEITEVEAIEAEEEPVAAAAVDSGKLDIADGSIIFSWSGSMRRETVTSLSLIMHQETP